MSVRSSQGRKVSGNRRKSHRYARFRTLQTEALEERAVMAYADVVLGDGPTMYLRLDEASGGNANDASPNNIDGTYSNFAAGNYAQPGALTNDANTSAVFDGADNYVALPTAAFGGYPTNASNFTFEIWFKTTSGGVILGNNGPATPGVTAPVGHVPSIYVDNAGFLRASMFWHDGTNRQNISSAPVNDGQWHHLLITYTGSTSTERLYIDGNFHDDQIFGQSSYSGAYDYYLGAGYTTSWPATPGGWYFFNGQLDEAASYNRVLTDQEIRQHYVSGNDLFQINVAAAPAGTEAAAYSRTATITDQEPATAYGGVLFAQSGVPGITGSQAITFDGVNDQVIAPDLARSASLRQRTVSGWFNSSTLAANFQNIFYKGTEDSCCGGREMALYLTSGGSLYFVSAAQGQNESILSTPAFATANNWYHYAAVVDADAGQMQVYVNGLLVATAGYSAVGMQDRIDPWRFGGTVGGTKLPFTGKQDEVAIFNRALTATEIADLASPSATYAARVLAKNPGQYFRFEETTGTRLNDQVQNVDSVTATYGDGQNFGPANVAAARSLTLTNTYADSGVYALNITAASTSSHGLILTKSFSSTINNVAPVPTITGTGVGTPGFPVSLTFAVTDVSSVDTAAGFNLSINWGDGSPLQTFTAHSGAPFALTHTYANLGNYNVQFTAVDKDSGTTTVTKAVKISNVAIDANGDLQIVGTSAPDRVTISPGTNGGFNIRFNNALTVVPAFPGNIYVYGKAGSDTITATQVTKRIVAYGDAGNDYIATVGGDDHLEGGPDNDRLLAGNGTNTVLGNDGNDLLQGGTGTDYLYGGAGNDTLNGMNGDDFLFGEDGKDTLNGSNGNDFLHGGAGVDTLGGDAGDDILIGGLDSDTLYGRAGRDILIGGRSTDRLLGSTGDDILIGEATIYDDIAIATNPLINTIRPAWSAATNIDAGILALTGLLGTAQIPTDGAPDTLTGEGDNDWFLYYFGLDLAKDQKANDRFKLL